MTGRQFSGQCYSQQDRQISNLNGGDGGVQSSEGGLPCRISDHAPIMFTNNNWMFNLVQWGPKLFRFMDVWLSNPKCMQIAKEALETIPTMAGQDVKL